MFKLLSKFFQNKKEEQVNRALINSGIKITVSIDDCEVKPVIDFVEEQQSGAMETIMLDALAGKDQLKQNKREGCYLIYKYRTENDEKRLLSTYIAKDPVTLSFILQQRRSITIYINPVNSSEYYFDLNFLDQ